MVNSFLTRNGTTLHAITRAILPRRTELPLLLTRPFEFRNRYRWPLFFLALAAFLDGATTYRFLHALGPAAEVHPVQRLIFSLLPPMAGILLAKSAQVIAAVLVAAFWQPWCKWLMLACGILYALAAASNHFGWL